MRARDKSQYARAWQSHCNELVTLAIAADVAPAEWEQMRSTLSEWIRSATERQDLPEGEPLA